MKKIAILSLFFLTLFSANAQTGWGAKGSLIFNSNGDLINEVGDIIDKKGSGGTGFNIGVYGNLDLGPVFIRPELVYSQAKSEYVIDPEVGGKSEFKMSSLDVPVLLGFRAIGPLNIILGPSFKFILDNKIEGLSYDSIADNVTVGINLGVSVKLGRFMVDVVYDRGFTKNEASFIGEDITDKFVLDTRPKQLLVGLSYRLSSKKK